MFPDMGYFTEKQVRPKRFQVSFIGKAAQASAKRDYSPLAVGIARCPFRYQRQDSVKGCYLFGGKEQSFSIDDIFSILYFTQLSQTDNSPQYYAEQVKKSNTGGSPDILLVESG
jgi:hypothetical protein